MMYSFAVHTLGCKVNQYETELIANDFLERGFRLVDFSDCADVYVINTCTVTEKSDHKSRQWIARAFRKNPDSLIAVTGCYAERAKTELERIHGVSLVLGNESKRELADRVCGSLEHANRPRTSSSGVQHFHTRALIKVQDGCNNFCSFCIVPHVRGAPRSRPLDDIISEISELSSSGVKEVVLTGINLGKYGKDLEPALELTDLLESVEEIPLLARFRLSSLEVQDLTRRSVEFLSLSKKFCRHLHIPLQSGDNDVLRSMNRNYTVEEYLDIICEVKKEIPGIAVTTDVMVGFPAETEAQFKKTKSAMEKAEFRKTHVFKYSDREGTQAFSFPGKVSHQIKDERSKELIQLGNRLTRNYLEKFIGKKVSVLVEKVKGDGRGSGITDNYIRVEFLASGRSQGELLEVLIEQRNETGLFGRVVP